MEREEKKRKREKYSFNTHTYIPHSVLCHIMLIIMPFGSFFSLFSLVPSVLVVHYFLNVIVECIQVWMRMVFLCVCVCVCVSPFFFFVFVLQCGVPVQQLFFRFFVWWVVILQHRYDSYTCLMML